MSRAFVKEDENVALEAPPDLDLGEGPFLVTENGFAQILTKVAEIEERLTDEADEAARNRLLRDLRYWAARKSAAEVVVLPPSDKVEFGSRVTILRDGRRQILQIVGVDEADPVNGRINWRAPLAGAILGASVGETVLWDERNPPWEIEILAVEPS